MKKETTYARVKPIAGSWKFTDDRRTVICDVTVSYSLVDFRPSFALGKYLLFRTDKTDYKVFNPQKLNFDLDRIVWVLKVHTHSWGEVYIGHSVEDADDRKF